MNLFRDIETGEIYFSWYGSMTICDSKDKKHRLKKETIKIDFIYSISDSDEQGGYHQPDGFSGHFPLGYLLMELLKANKEEMLDSWAHKYGYNLHLEEHEYELYNFIRNVMHILENEGQKDFGMNEIIHLVNLGYENGKFVYEANNILELITAEIIELQKLGKKYKKCDCGMYYIDRPRVKEMHRCPFCLPPSKDIAVNTELKREFGRYKSQIYNRKTAGKISEEKYDELRTAAKDMKNMVLKDKKSLDWYHGWIEHEISKLN